MLAKIQKWGNSQGLRISKNLLADPRLDFGDEVNISVKDGLMIVAPAAPNELNMATMSCCQKCFPF